MALPWCTKSRWDCSTLATCCSACVSAYISAKGLRAFWEAHATCFSWFHNNGFGSQLFCAWPRDCVGQFIRYPADGSSSRDNSGHCAPHANLAGRVVPHKGVIIEALEARENRAPAKSFACQLVSALPGFCELSGIGQKSRNGLGQPLHIPLHDAPRAGLRHE